jgi:molybdate transport system substrate-binding protein
VTQRLSALALALVSLAGCGGAKANQAVSGPRLTVLAAASLTNVLPHIDPSARYVFAGSDDLAAQISQGAPADVFLSAGPRPLEQELKAGKVGPPRVFARNRLVLVVPRANPAHIRRPADVVRPGVRLLLAGPTVPAGNYARRALTRLGLARAIGRATSQESDVRAVLAKVALGEADAGIVYGTDVAAAGGKVETIPLPAAAQPQITYLGSVVRAGDRAAAHAFLDRLSGPLGRSWLRRAGFLLP